MYKVLSGTKRIGSNGGTLAGLVGSYDQVIERIEAFHEAGVELFMLQFQPIAPSWIGSPTRSSPISTSAWEPT